MLSSKIKSLEEVSLDEKYYFVRAYWKMSIERNQQEIKEIEISATYILSDQNFILQIVLQIDHQDLMKKIEEAK